MSDVAIIDQVAVRVKSEALGVRSEELGSGLFGDREVRVAEDYVERFTTYLRERDKSLATVDLYAVGVTRLQEWFEEQTGKAFAPVALTPLDVRLFKTYLRDTLRLAAASVNAYLSGVRAFCAWAQAEGIAPHDPAQHVKLMKLDKPRPKWLGRQEQYQLIRVVEEQVQLGTLRAGGEEAVTEPGYIWPRRDRAVIRLMLAAGLRLSEVHKLDVADIELRPRSGSAHVRNGKGGKERHVALNVDARNALRAWLDVREHVAQPGQRALFVSQKGNRFSSRGIAGRVEVLSAKAGLEGIHAHTLRHSCAKNLIDAHVGIEQVAEVLGHENLETTQIYTRPSRLDLQRDVELAAWGDLGN